MGSVKVPAAHVIIAGLAVFCIAACLVIIPDVAKPRRIGLDFRCHAMLAGGASSDNDTPVVSMGSPTAGGGSSESPLNNSEANLESILKAAAMPSKTVIIAPLNEAWADPGSVLDIFFESFRIGIGTRRLLQNLVIVALDPNAYERCKVVHKHCFFLETPGVDFSKEKRFMTTDYLKLVWRKIEFLGSVLELSYSFVFTDVDIMWLRDPFPDLMPLNQTDSDADVVTSCDRYNGNPRDLHNKANSGFQYVKANYRSTAFYRYWYNARQRHPGWKTQDVFDVIKMDAFTKELGIKFRLLDPADFGNFCSIRNKKPSRLKTMHATCCIGIHNKASLLRIVLDDWANFITVAGLYPQPLEADTIVTSFPWRFPTIKKCRNIPPL